MEVNASYSGSCASNKRQGSGYPSLCDRVSLLGSPDTIIIALGTNDSNDSVPIGDFDFDADIDSLDESNFASAYIKGIKMIKSYYPTARVICLMFMAINQEYRNAVKTIANYYGLDYISIPYFESLGDDKHPSYKGMQRIANRLANIERDYAIEESKKSIAQNEEGIDSLNHIIGEPETMPIGITRESVYVGSDGSVKSSTNLYAIYNVEVKADTQIQLTCYTTSSVSPISIFKDDKYYPVVQPNNVSGIHTYFYYVESDCTIAFSGRLGSGSASEKKLVVRKSNLATNELVTSLATKLSPLAYEQTNEVNQIIDGVVSKVSTNTRYIYYRRVLKGEEVVIKGEITNQTKQLEWGLYSEIPTESSVAISFGKTNKVGENSISITIDIDGYLAVAINNYYHIGWGFYKQVSFREYGLDDRGVLYKPSQVKYIPHRGLRNAEIPENTTYSVMFAALYGLKYSECDVRYTSDGIGVVMHDATINRTMYNTDLSAISEDTAIADNTYEVLSEYVYKSTNPTYRTKLQTMREYIDACAQWDICPIIQGSMSDEDLAYCMQRLGDNWICYGGNFAKVREFSNNVLCLTSASYSSVETMVESLKSIGGNVGLSRLYNSELTDEYIAACKNNGFEVMASFAYQHVNTPDAIRRGVTIVLSDNVGKETNKVLASSIFGWDKFSHDGNVVNGKLVLNSNLSYKLSGKGNYKIYAQFEGEGTITLPDYDNTGVYGSLDFPMNNGVFIYTFAQLEDSDFTLRVNKSSDLVLERLIVLFEEVKI